MGTSPEERTTPITPVIGVVRFCVCVPARDEAAHLPILLDALAQQDLPGRVRVAISLNNTTDGSAAAISAAGSRWASRLLIHTSSVTFPASRAHAGSARRHAMELGASMLEHDDTAILISTDADARPPADWVRSNLEAIAEGADIVGGRLEIDDREPVPEAMARGRRLWDDYWTRVRAIEDEIDPMSWDPAPRHGDHTGASLAMRIRTWRLAGGVPEIPCGEDRALVLAARQIGARVSHPQTVWTRVSPRTLGRAEGGMAAHLQAMSQALDAGEHLTAPGLDQWRARALWRRRERVRLGSGVHKAEAMLPPMLADLRLDALEAA